MSKTIGINSNEVPVQFPGCISYCSNVYSGKTWDEISKNLATFSEQILNEYPEMGVGLWIPDSAISPLLNPSSIENLQEFFKETGICVRSLNGFPYYFFHNNHTKQKVFQPSWADPDRLFYTQKLMTLATQLLEQDAELGISTVPIGWGPDLASSKSDVEKAAFHLATFASDAYFAQRSQGLLIHLDLEPEPFGYLSTSQDVVGFFKNHLFKIGIPLLKNRWGITEDSAAQILLEKIRICYDTCHAAVEFETPRSVINRYDSLGIKIGRVQVSSAPVLHLRKGRCVDGTAPSEFFSNFRKDIYLHQVVGRDFQYKSFRFIDLQEALCYLESKKVSGEFRIHLHIPIFLEKFGPVFSTQNHIKDLISLFQSRSEVLLWEIETYTWNVLPSKFNPKPTSPLEEGILQECAWLNHYLKQTARKGISHVNVESQQKTSPRIDGVRPNF